MASFDCASDLNGKNNCDVSLEGVTFQGLGSVSMKTGMTCSGVKGAATALSGINDCLDHGPSLYVCCGAAFKCAPGQPNGCRPATAGEKGVPLKECLASKCATAQTPRHGRSI